MALVVCVVGLWGGTPSASTGKTEEPPGVQTKTPSEIRWGIYQINWGAERFEHFLDITIAKLASPPDFVMFYRDLRCRFPAKAIEIIRHRGATPSISLELGHWGDNRTKFLPEINAGEFDDYFETWARDAKAEGDPVFLRFGFEFNGDWFSWSGDPKGYIGAWRRIHAIFERVGADNVKWVWAPNVTSVPDTPSNNMHRYYPGDEYVDWVGIDGYNWGDNHDEWHTWQSCQQVFEKVLDEFDKHYANRPVMLAEFGTTTDIAGRKAEWIVDAYEWLTTQSRVSAVIWFNFDKRSEGEQDWRIDSTAESLEAFNRTFAKPN